MKEYATRRFEDPSRSELCLNPLSYIWEWFLEIFLFGGYGQGPFLTPYEEIEAYSRIMKVSIEPWEAKVLRELGGAYMSHYKRKSEQPGNLTKTVSMRDSEGLKALFANVGHREPKKGASNGFGRTGSQSR